MAWNALRRTWAFLILVRHLLIRSSLITLFHFWKYPHIHDCRWCDRIDRCRNCGYSAGSKNESQIVNRHLMHSDAFDRYHHGHSSIHSIDRRVKVLVTLAFIVSNALLPYARARGDELRRDRRAHGDEPRRRREHALPRPQAPQRGIRGAGLRRPLRARAGDRRGQGRGDARRARRAAARPPRRALPAVPPARAPGRLRRPRAPRPRRPDRRLAPAPGVPPVRRMGRPPAGGCARAGLGQARGGRGGAAAGRGRRRDRDPAGRWRAAAPGRRDGGAG